MDPAICPSPAVLLSTGASSIVTVNVVIGNAMMIKEF
jgi:hypothetical protein